MGHTRSILLRCGALGLGLEAMSASLAAQPVTPARAAGAKPAPLLAPSRDAYLSIAAQVEASLHKDVLDAWFPRTVDQEKGGFRSSFARDWTSTRSEGKFSVFQARMTWISAQVAMRRPELRERFLPYVAHGVAYLDRVMWDARYGGFYWGLDDEGQISPFYTDRKQLYGNAFCIYAAAAAYQATQDPKALALAQRGFQWIEEHAHDAENGGYHELLQRDGSALPAPAAYGVTREASLQPFPAGFKSMNTHIHLLEAFTELFRVWKNEPLRQRLAELLTIVRDRISVEPGAMNLYFTSDWRAVPDHDSYGHDVEAGYLMIEAAEVLGRPHEPKTERMARMLVDHALAYGWDAVQGGFFREGTTFGRPEDRQKEWWVQFEGLNALLLMHERYGAETESYFDAFQRQWQQIRERQIDAEHGGVYEMLAADGTPNHPGKGRIWKAAYHDGRSLLNVSEKLREMARAARD